MAADVGAGTTITFSTSLFAGQITSLSWSGISREAIDTTDMDITGGRTFLPTDTYDPGEITIEFNADLEADAANYITAIDAAIESGIIVDWGGIGTPDRFTADGFATNLEFNAPENDKITGSCTIKLTGDITAT